MMMVPVTVATPGIEQLAGLTGFIVKQELELFEMFTGFETQNRYTIMTPQKQPFMFAAEESSLCSRCCLGSYRPFTVHIIGGATPQEPRGSEILTLQRPYTCYFHELAVFDTKAQRLLGRIVRKLSLCERNFDIYDATGVLIYRIRSPCCSPWSFSIMTTTDQECGMIRKKWGGFLKEALTDADTFGLDVHIAMSAAHKAILLGAVFLIDFCFFEENQHQGASLN